MVRQISVLILVFAIVGLAFAEIKVVSSTVDAPTPTSGSSDDIIGSPVGGSGGEDVNEAPIGGPVSPGAFSSTGAKGPGPNSSGATAIKALGVVRALVAGGIAGFFTL